jgi:geranylgeranyl pyrophosphate synthase
MDLKSLMEGHRGQVNNALNHYFEKKRKDVMEKGSEIAQENYTAMQNYILGNGKRLRGICALLAYEACGGKESEKMVLPSLSVEFFHNSSLILDDVMDEDKERREITAAHELIMRWFDKKYGTPPYSGYLFSNNASRFGVSMSIIATNMLFSLGAQTILDSEFSADKKIRALDVYEKTYRLVNLGQMLDMHYEIEKSIDSEKYLRMAHLKTGVLLGSALKIGAVLAGAPASQLNALDEYAQYSATTFQIQDDILDLTPGSKKGRELGSDLKKGKTTLIILLAKENLPASEWKIIEKVLGNEKANESELQKAMKILHEKGVIERAQTMAAEYNTKGKKALRKAKPEFAQKDLEIFDAFADYLVNRNT